jgi:hypothetical protein
MFKDSGPSDPASCPESLQLGERGDMGDYTEQQCSGVPTQADRRPQQRPVWLNKKQMNVEIRLGFGRCRLSILNKQGAMGRRHIGISGCTTPRQFAITPQHQSFKRLLAPVFFFLGGFLKTVFAGYFEFRTAVITGNDFPSFGIRLQGNISSANWTFRHISHLRWIIIFAARLKIKSGIIG